MSRTQPSLLILVSLACAPALAHAQTIWHVDDDCAPPGTGTEVDPLCTIQQGVDAAFDGDTVLVHSGTYTGEGNRDISLFGKTIALRSTAGPAVTIIDSEGDPASIHRGFFLDHGETRETTIKGFTITGGYLIGDTGGSGVSGGGGGAAVYWGASSATLRECVIVGNVSRTLGNPFIEDGRGGGLYLDRQSSALIEDCVIVANEADRQGGGVLYIGGTGTAVGVRNSLLAYNVADQGGAIHSASPIDLGSIAYYDNNTVVNNFASISAGGIQTGFGDVFIHNCIIWDNDSPFAPQLYARSELLHVEFSAVAGGLEGVEAPDGIEWGPGNIDADPLFFDSERGDFHLLHGSPCIDAGNNLAVPEDVTTDLDGGPRFLDVPDMPDTGNPDGINPIVDMGSYEYDPDDCNNNDTPDDQDIAEGTSQDCNGNGNGIPDECEPDCNENDQADSCDIAEGISEDCTGNGIPDECEPDCNDNGQPDSCDIAEGLSEDCNSSGVPDECEPDCNGNGVQDMCDIAAGFSQDCGADGVPDDCPENPGPVITAQPVSQEVAPGDLVFFSVQADGVLLEYQWRKDGVDLGDTERIFGTNTPGLIIFEVVPVDAGSYDCVVTDFFGACATSNGAELTVTDPCPADFDGSGAVGPFDLAILLGHWGPNPKHPADLNDDDIIDAADLALLLGNWGPCE